MTERERFIKKLRDMSLESLPYVITMPPKEVGHPDGTVILKNLLDYIADCMDGKFKPKQN